MIKITYPVDDLEQWTRGVDRLLNSIFLNERSTGRAPWRPSTDVYETEDLVVIKVEIAGMSADEFQISFADHVLQIRGNREDIERKRSYHCLEIPYGEFASEVYLPGIYAESEIEARYENGFLIVTLPKLKPQPPQTIEVHATEK